MFGIGRQNFSLSVYLFFFLLIVNQLILVQSFRFIINDQDQNQLEGLQRDALRRMIVKNFITPDDSSSDDNDLQVLFKPTIQRRFCCMSPLSGRKRFVRDLAKKQQTSHLLNE